MTWVLVGTRNTELGHLLEGCRGAGRSGATGVRLGCRGQEGRWPGVEAGAVKVPFFLVPEGQAPNIQPLGEVRGRISLWAPRKPRCENGGEYKCLGMKFGMKLTSQRK